MPNLKKSSAFLMNGGKLRNVNFDKLEELTGGTLISTYENITHFNFPKLRESNGAVIFINRSYRTSVCTIELPVCEKITYPLNISNPIFTYAPDIVNLIMKDGVYIDTLFKNGSGDNNIQELHITCKEIYGNEIHEKSLSCPHLGGEKIFFNALRKSRLWFGSGASNSGYTTYIYINCIGGREDEIIMKARTYDGSCLVSDIELSQGARQPFNFTGMFRLTATNIVNHIFDRLADNRFEDDGVTPAPAITITLGSTNLSKLTDAQKAIATNKNYILA